MQARSGGGWRLAALVAGLLWAASPVFAAPTSTPPATAAFQSIAPSAILLDAASGAVLFEKDADALVSPASTAKLMTAEVVFHALAEGRLRLDDTFIVSENAWRRGGAPSGGSTMFAALNSKVRVEDLLRGLAVVSGNDACIVLAEGLAGTEDAFAARLTDRARALGLTASHFSNVWGRDEPGEKVTAREMGQLALHLARAYPAYVGYFGEREFAWNKIKQTNRNPLLGMNIGADGMKTGETADGGYGLVGSAVQNGQRLVVVVYGLRTARDRANEAAKLLGWGFRAFAQRTVFGPGELVGTASVFGGEAPRVSLVADGPVTLLEPREGAEPLTGRIVYTGPLPAPVESGAVVAHLKLTRGKSEVLDVPLRTAQNVGVGSLPRRALDAGFELFAGWLHTNVVKR